MSEKTDKELKKLSKEKLIRIINDIHKERFIEGEIKVYEYFRDNSIGSIERGFNGVDNTAIIKRCNKEITRLNSY